MCIILGRNSSSAMTSGSFHIAHGKHVDKNNNVKYATVSFMIGDIVLILNPASFFGAYQPSTGITGSIYIASDASKTLRKNTLKNDATLAGTNNSAKALLVRGRQKPYRWRLISKN